MSTKIRPLQAIVVFVLLTTMYHTGRACNIPPTAKISNPDPQWVYVGHEFCFDGHESYDIDGQIMHWKWEFDDGSDPCEHDGPPPDCTVAGKAKHAYEQFGTYYPSLGVIDDHNATGTADFTVYVVEWDLKIQTGYTNKVAVNNNDDNENGIMDKKFPDEQYVYNEHDLVPIILSVNSTKSSDDVGLEIKEGKSHIKIWSNQDKRDLVIPDGTDYFKRWSAGEWTKTLWVEGIAQSAEDEVWLHMYYVKIEEGGGEGCVARDPAADLYFTVLEVDMDMDGVRDNHWTYGEVTDEITPGGSVGLGDRVHVELMKVKPTTLTGNVWLDVFIAPSRVELQDQQGDPLTLPENYWTPSELPEDVWVKGIDTSSSLRDITLKLTYPIDGVTFVDKIDMTVYSVDSVVWEKYPGNNNLGDPCPTNNEGKFMFPGKYTYDDEHAADRRKVTVKATITPVLEGSKVYFSWWDVDDPSNDPIIDTNGSTGGDNRGSGEQLSEAYAETDASGHARVTFTVSMQPGDNFRIAAAPSPSKLAEMDQTKADANNPPDGVALTEMLTVWRKLHVELDSMEQVATTGPEQNWVTGLFDDDSCSYDPNTNTTIVNLGQDLAACWEETKSDHFVGGWFRTPTIYPPLETIWHYGNDEIKVSGNCLPGGQALYYLQDQDDWNLLPSLPDTGKLNSIFDDCYIECVADAPGSTNTVAFKRNLGGAETSGSDVRAVTDPARGSAAYEAGDYWVVYALSIFQLGYSHDKDPNSDPGQAGATEDNYQASVIPLENIRDAAACYGYNATTLEQQSVVHEIGHQVLESDAHTAGTIMNSGLPVYFWQEKFGPSDIAAIRSKTSSPGN